MNESSVRPRPAPPPVVYLVLRVLCGDGEHMRVVLGAGATPAAADALILRDKANWRIHEAADLLGVFVRYQTVPVEVT